MLQQPPASSRHSISRSQRRSRRLLLGLLTICAAFLTGFGPPRLTDRELSPTRRLDSADLRALLEAQNEPDISAAALLVYDVDADGILYARAMDEARPVASLTKLMTALLVLEAGNLDAQVTIADDDLIGGAAMGLIAGDTLTVEELLWGLLVPSGNDAAMALARHTAGSADEFTAQMNARADELGLTASAFRNPHGLDESGHVSSAQDLLTLTRLAQEFPLFRTITATAATTVGGYKLENTNELLTTYAGTTGVKTGTTDLAGQCLIAEITRDGHPLIIEVLGSRNRYEDVRRLHAYYQANYVWLNGDFRALDLLNRLRDESGTLWYMTAEGDAPQSLVARGAYPGLQAYRRIERPAGSAWFAGMVVGVVEWRLGDQVVGRQRLILR